jgi:hypothetical protein
VTLRWLLATWDDYFGAVSICVVIWLAIALADGDMQGFWPIWVAGPWGAYLAFATVKGLATGEPQRWAARKQRKRELKVQRRDGRRPSKDELRENRRALKEHIRYERHALHRGRDQDDSDAAEA